MSRVSKQCILITITLSVILSSSIVRPEKTGWDWLYYDEEDKAPDPPPAFPPAQPKQALYLESANNFRHSAPYQQEVGSSFPSSFQAQQPSQPSYKPSESALPKITSSFSRHSQTNNAAESRPPQISSSFSKHSQTNHQARFESITTRNPAAQSSVSHSGGRTTRSYYQQQPGQFQQFGQQGYGNQQQQQRGPPAPPPPSSLGKFFADEQIPKSPKASKSESEEWLTSDYSDEQWDAHNKEVQKGIDFNNQRLVEFEVKQAEERRKQEQRRKEEARRRAEQEQRDAETRRSLEQGRQLASQKQQLDKLSRKLEMESEFNRQQQAQRPPGGPHHLNEAHPHGPKHHSQHAHRFSEAEALRAEEDDEDDEPPSDPFYKRYYNNRGSASVKGPSNRFLLSVSVLIIVASLF